MLSVVPIVPIARSVAPRRAYVLLVDDHVQSLRRLSMVVASAGYSCEIATSAAEALAYCDAQRPQVVVTDLTMPNLDGRGLAVWLRARYPSVPLLLMTGQELDAAMESDLRQTFTAVLRKPLDVESFLSLLDRLMPANSSLGRSRSRTGTNGG